MNVPGWLIKNIRDSMIGLEGFTGRMVKNEFEVDKRWQEHLSQAVKESKPWKNLWNFNVQTDHVIETQPLNW